ncbi:hypothetical protein BDZ89DRAFT_322422 [Hymenopellis radicata]|nr:hypothetical protein BDZ89DRAFT_322422 [Hymenopellis radicata]
MPSPDIATARVNGAFWAPNDVPSHSWTSQQSRVNGGYRETTGEASCSAHSVADMDNMDGGYDSGSLTPRQREKSAVRLTKPRAATVTAPLKQPPDLDGKGGTAAEANWYHEISEEFTDMCAVMVDALQQFCPSQILEPAKEQFAASSVSVPAPTLSALHCALKNISFIAQNLTTFTSRNLKGIGDARETFDIGDLLQGVGDMLAGLAVKRKVELVIYHGDDNLHEQGQQAVKAVDFHPIYVRGNERCLTYALAHIVRQVLMIAQPGDSIELGLFMFPQHRPDLEELQADSGFDERPQVFGLPARCIIDIAHKFTGRDTRHAPNLETTLLQRLLSNADAELTMDSLFRPQCAVGRACELSFTLETSQPPIAESSPSIIHGVAEQPLMSHEPTFEQLADFGHELKDKKFSVTVYTKELSTEPLLASLSSWGVDLAVVGNGESANAFLPEKPSKGGRPFVFIDDDVEILKSQIQATNPVPTKRPAIHRVQSSSTHVTARQNSNSHAMITIVYFTSLDNFRLIREVVRAAAPFAIYPEVVVVPKPVGPRRLLTILYMALNKPRVDPSLSPSATSPSAPVINVPNGGLLTPSSSGEIPKPGSPRPIGPRSNSSRSVGSSTKENLPATPVSPATEYFPAKFTDNNPLTGIRIQDSEGAVQGIYFNPKGKSDPSSPTGVVNIPLADTFASMQELTRFLPVEPEQTPVESPLERIYHSRRTSTPQGSTAAPRLGPEHNVVPPIKVLVVDDNRINREICGKALRKIGVASDLAVNGQDALNKWRTGEFHMILMDIQMPVMGGLEATKQIRHEEKMMALAGLPHGTPVAEGSTPGFTPPVRTPSESGSTPYPSSVVIVALTASRDEEDRVQALAAGCNDFLTKPVSTVWLHNKVTEWGSIKALQQWAPTDLPENIRESQVQRAKRVASGLVPPTERRTPSPGQGKRIEPPPQPDVTSPPLSAPSSGAASSSSWAEPSPMTFSGNLGVPTPVTAGFSPRGGQASYGQSLNGGRLSPYVMGFATHERRHLVIDGKTSRQSGITSEANRRLRGFDSCR